MSTTQIGGTVDDTQHPATVTWSSRGGEPPPYDAGPILDENDPASAAMHARTAGRLLLMTLPLIVSDLAALIFAGAVSDIVIHALRIAPSSHFSWAMPFVVLPILLAYVPWGLYTSVGMHPVVELRELTKVNTIALVATLTGCIVTRVDAQWPFFFLFAWLASLVFVPFLRSRVRPGFASRSWWGYPVLVVSSGGTARKVVKMMLKAGYAGLRPCGVVDPTTDRRGFIQGIPRLGGRSDTLDRRFVAETGRGIPRLCGRTEINSLIRSHGIRHCVIALPEMPEQQVMEVIDNYRGQIPYLMVMSKSSDMPLLWGNSMDCGGMSGIGVRNGLMLATPRLIKRSTDIVLSLTGIIGSLPLFALAALIVKISSPGPLFFGHNRLGFGGQKFRAWKFRTMRTDSEATLRQLLESDPVARADWERDHKLKNDPRIIRFGHFLRQSSLDELPQLWNVLKGEMSLVGPRPIVDQEIEKYGKVFKVYKDVKPGITGLWQVSGRNDTSYEERVQLDNYYVRNWSPWLDIHILARTVEVLARRQGAY